MKRHCDSCGRWTTVEAVWNDAHTTYAYVCDDCKSVRPHLFVASRKPYVNPSVGEGFICWCEKHKLHSIHIKGSN